MAAAASSNRIKSTRLTALGRYRLLATIGQGGMAEVFLASLDGPAQFSKLMAVKVLRAELAEDPEGRQMFLEEARLAARLAHPNVVQTVEVGEAGNTLFIAMEYLDGQPLSRMMLLARNGTVKMPMPLVVRILADALTGLHYAHELRDYQSKPLELVHRDVSPANIFVTYDGQVKVLDFGIAKAADGDAQTRAGVLKGKVGYLSPEQLSDAKPDRRIDVYAAGVILWEALTARRLWKGIPDMTALSRITNEGVPSPRTVAPDVDPALEAICIRATAKNRDERYESAAAMVADLESYLETCGEQATGRTIGKFMSTAFADLRKDTQALIERQVARSRELATETLDALVSSSRDPSALPPMPVMPVATTTVDGTGSVSTPIVVAKKRWPIYAAVAGAVIAVVAVAWATQRPGSAAQPAAPAQGVRTAKLTITAAPQSAMITLDGVMVGAASGVREVSVGRHVVHVEAAGFVAYDEIVMVDGEKTVSVSLAPTAVKTAQPVGAVAPPTTAKQPVHPTTPPAKTKSTAPAATMPPPAATVAAPATATATATKKKTIDEENPFSK